VSAGSGSWSEEKNRVKPWTPCNARNDEAAEPSSDDGARAPADAGGSSFVGQVLGDRFVVERKLGQGTVGTVYRAEDRRDRRPVAVKILNPAHQPGSPGVARLLDDAQRATRLLHPNVVPLIDHGVHAERFVYLVEPLLEGQELSQKLGEDRALTPEAVMQLGVSMLHALEALHRQDLLHLDLKPSNVFLMRDPFGMERAAVSSVGTRHLLGFEGISKPAAAPCFARPEYLCPEIVGGKPADARSDIYGVGVVLYEALAGRAPFAGGQLAVAAKRHVYEKPLGFKLARPTAKVPDALEALVLRCLNKSSGARYANASELTRALEKLLGGATSAESSPTSSSAVAAKPSAEATPAVNPTLLMASGLLFKKAEAEPVPSAPVAAEPAAAPEAEPEVAAAPVIVSAAEAAASLTPQKTEPQASPEPAASNAEPASIHEAETKPFTPVAPVAPEAETKPFVSVAPEVIAAPPPESAPVAEPTPSAESALEAEQTSAGDEDDDGTSAEATAGAANGVDRKGGKKNKKNKKGKRDTGAPANIASVAAPEAKPEAEPRKPEAEPRKPEAEPRKPEAEPASGKTKQAPATPKADEPDWFELGETSVAALDEYHRAAEKEERSKFPLIVGGVLLVLGLGAAVIATRSPSGEATSGKNPQSIGELAAAKADSAPKSAAPASSAPTAAPTQAPTAAPTLAPTQAPTAPPTLSALEAKRLAAQQAAEQAAEQARAAAEAKRLAAQQAAEQARAAAEAKRLAAQQAAQAAAAKRAAMPAPASGPKPAAPAGPSADSLVAEGRKSLKEARYTEARKSFEAALRTDPRSAAAYAGLGDTAFQEQKFMDAVRNHTNAVRYAPRNVDYLLALGMACFKAEQLQDARKHWEKALSLQPGNEKATKYLKLVEKRLGQ